MAKVWKKLQRADSDFSGNVTGKVNNVNVSNVYTTSNKPSKADVGLGNVTNESKATMFANPTFTGTATGLSKASVGLGNVDNSLFTSSGKFKGAITKSDGTTVYDPSAGNFTGKIDGSNAKDVKDNASDAKDAVDGNANITMVGGSLSIGTQSGGVFPFSVDTSGNLKIKDDEFQALADGTVNCKGNFTIKQDSNGDSKIVLEGDSTGTAEVEVNGANPTFDLGGASPLGTSTLYIRRGGTSNQGRIQFRTGTGSGSNELNIGVSNNTINGRQDQYAIHYGPIWSSGTAHERALSFDYDGKIGMYANTKTVAGFTFGSDGTNKNVYIKDGGLSIGTTTVSDGDLRCTDVFARHLNATGDIYSAGDLTVTGQSQFEDTVQFDAGTVGISYNSLSNRPTIPYNPVGTTDKIFFTPADFIANDDQSYFNYAMVDNGAQGRVMSSSLEAYANVLIPQGYKCTHVRVNGTASVQVHLYYSDTGSSSVTSAQITSYFTNAENAVNPSSGIAATTAGRYMVIKWNPTSTSHRVYGGYIKIASI